LFDSGVINNVDDVLLISLVVIAINSAAPSDLWYTLFCGRLTDDRIKCWLLSVFPARQLGNQPADPNFFTTRYDTIEEFNVDSKAEYSA